MSNKETSPQLRFEDLHPTLKSILNIGAEVGAALDSTIRKQGKEKTALNLCPALIENRRKIIQEKVYDPYSDTYRTVDVYAKEKGYKVQFSVEKDQKIEDYSVGMGLDNTHSPEQAIQEAEKIALDLQALYGLPYTPNIFVEGKLLKKK